MIVIYIIATMVTTIRKKMMIPVQAGQVVEVQGQQGK